MRRVLIALAFIFGSIVTAHSQSITTGKVVPDLKIKQWLMDLRPDDADYTCVMFYHSESPQCHKYVSHIKSITKQASERINVIIITKEKYADAGVTLYTVGSVKTVTGYKSYVSVDGGMPDNPRYALYESPYTVVLANRMNDEKSFVATVAGRCCESGDILQENVALPHPTRGDILAVLVTGAYNYSMASNYNRIPRPPLVLLSEGKDTVGVRRESYEDLLRLDE